VAVIDSGVDLTHPDLVANLWRNPGEIAGNGIDDDANGFVDDVHGWDFVEGDAVPQDGFGHGTHVAGIIGNQGSDVDATPRYPGAYDLANVINVAAASPDGDLARLSNWGATRVDLAAPGTLVVSTWPGGRTGTLSGTSMAAPHVSGAIALLAAARPGITVDAMRAALLGSTRPIASHAGRTVTGGMLDVRGALAAVGAGPPWTRGGPDAGGGIAAGPKEDRHHVAPKRLHSACFVRCPDSQNRIPRS